MNRISKSKQRLASRLGSRRTREREGLALAEGPRVILEALRSPVEVRWVLVGEKCRGWRPGQEIVAACGERGIEAEIVPDDDVRDLCATDAPQPALACVRPPGLDRRSLDRGRYLMTSGVRNPGNLGTLIRSAWGFGLDGVVLTGGSVDPWNAKVVRASAGAVFHVPLIDEPMEDGHDEWTTNIAGACAHLNLLYGDPAGPPVDSVEETRATDWVLVVGNEVAGISPMLRPHGRAVSVPLARGVDSLNVAVAGSILMYLLTRPGREA